MPPASVVTGLKITFKRFEGRKREGKNLPKEGDVSQFRIKFLAVWAKKTVWFVLSIISVPVEYCFFGEGQQ